MTGLMAAPTGAPLLVVNDVAAGYRGAQPCVRGVSLAVHRGECVALVGASGCGKSTLARAITGLLPRGAAVSGSILLGGTQVVGAPDVVLRRLRGRTVGVVSQNPFAACNPVHSLERHVAEAWRAHGEQPPPGRVVELLARNGIDDAERRARQRPHQWSGGMLQRATIAAACAFDPPLVIADEPTSALDAHLADGILRQLCSSEARALLLISHDLAQVSAHADRIAVMHGGQIVEIGPTSALLEAPEHPYTRALLAEQLR